MENIPYGYCECGCGEKVRLAPQTERRKGWVKGQPMRFAAGWHAVRARGPEYIEDPRTGCWVWQHDKLPPRGGASYGRYNKGGDRRPAHVVYWERQYGPVPPGMELHHVCVEEGYGNTLCCRPDHLVPVTHRENVRRGRVALLNIEQVQRIKQMLREGYTQSEIARMHGVTSTAIHLIAKGENWSDV